MSIHGTRDYITCFNAFSEVLNLQSTNDACSLPLGRMSSIRFRSESLFCARFTVPICR